MTTADNEGWKDERCRNWELPTAVSLDQLLGIWTELVEAMHGVNGYGGDTAEIYAYRLLRFDPRILHEPWVKQMRREQAIEARVSVYLILKRFESQFDRRCEVDGHKSAWEWFQRVDLFDHRIHVKVVTP
jgi:hypothetical protein